MRPFFIYLIIYAVLAVAHVIAISYPEGAWSDDWIGYYASSARWFSASGPVELGRRIMAGAFDPIAGTARDWEVARAVFHIADPYMGWAGMHALLVRTFSLPPDAGFLVLQLFGCALYLISLKVFAEACLSELPGQGPGPTVKRLTPLVVLLQASYLGNPLFIGPLIFNPAMFVLPFALLFLGFLPRASFSWLRLPALALMILVHSSGIIFAIACLGTSFLYRILGMGSQATRDKKVRGLLQECIVVLLTFLSVIAATKLEWIPSPYPLSVSDYRLGLDFLGARRVWKFVGTSLVLIVLGIIPFSLYHWRRYGQRAVPFPIAFVIWSALGICSLAMLSLVQIWTQWQPALVRFMYTAWPLLLVSVFVYLVWLVFQPRRSKLFHCSIAAALLVLVVINVRDGIRFQKTLSGWRDLNNCRFLFKPTREQIRRLADLPGGLAVVFSARAGGSIGFMAGAGDYPVYYSRLTPDWRERVHGDGRRFVLVVAPLGEYLDETTTGPNAAPKLSDDKWKIIDDVALSRKGSMNLGRQTLSASLHSAAQELKRSDWGCDGASGSVYRLTVYQRA